MLLSVAEPGVLGGRGPGRGGVDSRGGYFWKILYVEMKESGPLGGRAPAMPPLDPPIIYCKNNLQHVNYRFSF